jgi:hypothetical protein
MKSLVWIDVVVIYRDKTIAKKNPQGSETYSKGMPFRVRGNWYIQNFP